VGNWHAGWAGALGRTVGTGEELNYPQHTKDSDAVAVARCALCAADGGGHTTMELRPLQVNCALRPIVLVRRRSKSDNY
jgi:hypothetical protein